MTDLQSKTDEELNVMLAGLAGWVAADSRDGFWHVENNQTGEKRGTTCYRGLDKDHAERVFFPKFTTSLDEVARVEAGLTDEQKAEYAERYLPFYSGAETSEQGPIDFWKLVTATARQRTIALISTLTKTP